MIKHVVFFALFLFSIISDSISAQPYVNLDNVSKIELNEHNLWLQTQSLDTGPNFVELSRLYENANRTISTLGGSGAYITKVKLTNITEKKNTWFVNIKTNFLDIGTAYWQSDSDKPILLERFGQIESENPKLVHSQAFSLPLGHEESGTLWVFIQAKMYTTPSVIKLYSKKEFYNNQFFINSITSISFAVMITLALFALFIYLRTKYLVTLACAGYIGLHGLGWLAASGSLGHLFKVTAFNPVYLGIMIFPLAIACASQFTKLLFNCHRDHLKLAKAYNLLSIVSLILAIVMPFIPFTASYVISHAIAIVWIPLCIGTGIFMLGKKDFRAKYYLTGNLLYGLALALYVLSHIYKLDSDISSELIVLIALTVDCICILLSLSEWLQLQQKELYRSYSNSRIDPLTQIGNRFAQNEMLTNLTGHYCLTFIDLDDFKKINDKFGHDEGDKFLIATADIIKKKLQDLGSVFRCGGDEFVLVAAIESEGQAQSRLIQISDIMQKTEQELQQTEWEYAGLSFGIATSFETLNQSECLSLADQRMYEYKKESK
ncbi:MAG: diguanylate cyclase (GGDEF)-like protein [Oceanospirillaceae bacterium]|jgi:diguanylate cyclase (GGDEF)-like protein